MLILKASKEASFVEQLNTVEEVLVFFSELFDPLLNHNWLTGEQVNVFNARKIKTKTKNQKKKVAKNFIFEEDKTEMLLLKKFTK